jgi:hypothetical protein
MHRKNQLELNPTNLLIILHRYKPTTFKKASLARINIGFKKIILGEANTIF